MIAAIIALLIPLIHLAGVLHAIHAIMTVRTSQGAVAWAISLVTFPYVAIPAYWVLGRSHFEGYVEARRYGNLGLNRVADDLLWRIASFRVPADAEPRRSWGALERLVRLPFTRGNRAGLLVDGDATFRAIFEGIESARNYVLVQFFIIHDDRIGRELKERLVRKAREGVPVRLLYDEIGSHELPRAYVEELRAAGVNVHAFRTTRGRANKFQLNFRNHRKITIADGRVAFVGGLNAGDEYMGRSARFGPWRDTHVQIEGPAVQCVQLAFLEDWYWATREVPELDWNPKPVERSDQPVLILPTGPADDLESCSLFFAQAIDNARRRLWITSPYFVPDHPVVEALQLAALRGVDVRILLPLKPDHLLVYLSAFSYFNDMLKTGVKLYRYQLGFMHQKVLLADDVAAVGTANLDNRSFRLNFELTALVADKAFAAEVERMLEKDLANCRPITTADYDTRPRWFKLAVHTSRLLSPVQ